ncbi:PIN-like domain-containing protein [Microbacterium sp. NPDC087665]|uniref:PIN-like domain-containing protein n=1 Tax=Microbacterium sp. NPDC087665 TaxID=3364194 RepID=UPI0038098E3C
MTERRNVGDEARGLFSGFEHYRILGASEIRTALENGMIALDTNVLLSLYRYNDKTVQDLLSIVNAAGRRLFIPHQVMREFWRNRQAVIASLGGASKDAQAALGKNAASTKDAISRWAKNVAIPDEDRSALLTEVDTFYAKIRARIGNEPVRIETHTPTARDSLLAKLEHLLDGIVGPPLDEAEWADAVAEGEKRVENLVPPGYMDAGKLESDLPEGASGDYLVWHQLLAEGRIRGTDCILVTADTKEDWWNRGERGAAIGPRMELIEEYLAKAGHRFFLLEPADLLRHSTVLGVGTNPESLNDIERVRDEVVASMPWTAEAVNAVLGELDAQGQVQASVIREAVDLGGRISRARVYELDGRDEGQMLRGFTRPVTRVTAELVARDVIPDGLPPLLDAVYEEGVKSSHFAVPQEVVQLFDAGRNSRTWASRASSFDTDSVSPDASETTAARPVLTITCPYCQHRFVGVKLSRHGLIKCGNCGQAMRV